MLRSILRPVGRALLQFAVLPLALCASLAVAADTTEVRVVVSPGTPAELVIANREIITLRAQVMANTPEQRVTAILQRLNDALEAGERGAVRDSAVFDGRAIIFGRHPLMFISPLDLDPSVGETMEGVTARTMTRMSAAIIDLQEMRDSRSMIRNVAMIMLYTGLFGLALWGLGRLRRWLRVKAAELVQRSIERSGIKGALTRGHTAVLVAQRLAMVVIGVLMLVALYFWLTGILDRIPITRAWSEEMFSLVAQAALWMLDGVVAALPGLAVVLVIILITRWITRTVKTFFDRIQSGEIEVTWVDASIAAPTRRVIVLLLWIFALVIAYPYIPGSSSRAFQGVGVLAGLMLSLGSSGVISQAMSGLALMFNRLIRVGECAQVGDVVTGVVKQIGYFNTVFVTSYGEEVTVPNGIILSAKVVNLSRHAGKGILWTTGVTIGYDTPWRQVHGMLLEAARHTPDIATDPAPTVAQHALNDFYVDYRLTVIVQGPFRQTLSVLHANIQDIFNVNGVQIMSPHYNRDPESAKVVPPEKKDPVVRKQE